MNSVLKIRQIQWSISFLTLNLTFQDPHPLDKSNYSIIIFNRNSKNAEEDLKFHIWDTDWQDDMSGLNLYFRGWHGVLLVYDVTNQDSFFDLNIWWEVLKENLPNANVVLVGNKSDLKNLQTVWEEDGQRFAEDNWMGFYETSALNWTNINEAFYELLKSVVETNLNSEK